jgi:hypothetical protein
MSSNEENPPPKNRKKQPAKREVPEISYSTSSVAMAPALPPSGGARRGSPEVGWNSIWMRTGSQMDELFLYLTRMYKELRLPR